MKKISSLILLLSLSLLLTSCTKNDYKSYDNEIYEIGVVTKSRNSEYWMSVCSGMEKAGNDLAVNVTIFTPDSELDEEVQTKMIYDLIDKKVDALAISPINSYGASDYVEYANKNEVSLFSFDTKIAYENIPYIGIDNEKAGYDAAKSMVGIVGEKGSIGIVAGNQKQSVHKERVEGFTDYIENNTQLGIAFFEEGYSNRRISVDLLSSLIKENPDLKGIFATSAVTALGIIDFIEEKDKDICIGSVDAQTDTLKELEKGSLSVLVSQNGYDIGYKTIEYIVNDLNGIKQKNNLIIDADIITHKEK